MPNGEIISSVGERSRSADFTLKNFLMRSKMKIYKYGNYVKKINAVFLLKYIPFPRRNFLKLPKEDKVFVKWKSRSANQAV